MLNSYTLPPFLRCLATAAAVIGLDDSVVVPDLAKVSLALGVLKVQLAEPFWSVRV
jgi:hypothetical protein